MALRFSRLTRPAIRKLRPGQEIAEFGIIARCLPDGDTRYAVNIQVDGQRIHRVIGRASQGTNRSQAEQYIAKARSDAKAGRLDLPKGRKTHLGFDETARKYLALEQEDKGRNLTAKRRQIRMYLGPFFGNQRLDKISTFTVDRYKKRRIASGASNATINRELATLRHLHRRAVDVGWIPMAPLRITTLPESEGRIIALTDDQIGTLITAAIADEDPYCWLFVAFGLNTAMRHSEILASRFDQVRFDLARLHIPKAKAGERDQPLTPELVDILENERAMREDQHGWIFPSPRPNASLSGHRHRMSKPFRRAVLAAGMDPSVVTPHVMRHTAITKLVEAGVDLSTVQRISGHKTLKMVQRYTHVRDHHIDESIQAIGIGFPEPIEHKTPGTASQKLHMVPKRTA